MWETTRKPPTVRCTSAAARAAPALLAALRRLCRDGYCTLTTAALNRRTPQSRSHSRLPTLTRIRRRCRSSQRESALPCLCVIAS